MFTMYDERKNNTNNSHRCAVFIIDVVVSDGGTESQFVWAYIKFACSQFTCCSLSLFFTHTLFAFCPYVRKCADFWLARLPFLSNWYWTTAAKKTLQQKMNELLLCLCLCLFLFRQNSFYDKSPIYRQSLDKCHRFSVVFFRFVWMNRFIMYLRTCVNHSDNGNITKNLNIPHAALSYCNSKASQSIICVQ